MGRVSVTVRHWEGDWSWRGEGEISGSERVEEPVEFGGGVGQRIRGWQLRGIGGGKVRGEIKHRMSVALPSIFRVSSHRC